LFTFPFFQGTSQVSPGEQEVATTLDLLVIYLQVTVWEINFPKLQEPSISVKFWGWGQHCRTYQDTTSKMKNKLLHLAPSTTKEKEKEQLSA
jgi:hypothetical protein